MGRGEPPTIPDSEVLGRPGSLRLLQNVQEHVAQQGQLTDEELRMACCRRETERKTGQQASRERGVPINPAGKSPGQRIMSEKGCGKRPQHCRLLIWIQIPFPLRSRRVSRPLACPRWLDLIAQDLRHLRIGSRSARSSLLGLQINRGAITSLPTSKNGLFHFALRQRSICSRHEYGFGSHTRCRPEPGRGEKYLLKGIRCLKSISCNSTNI